MNEKLSVARLKYWSEMDPEEKSIRMSNIAKTRQKKLTFKQRRDHAMRMVAAKRAKKNAILK